MSSSPRSSYAVTSFPLLSMSFALVPVINDPAAPGMRSNSACATAPGDDSVRPNSQVSIANDSMIS
jgi:hypothetical protein